MKDLVQNIEVLRTQLKGPAETLQKKEDSITDDLAARRVQAEHYKASWNDAHELYAAEVKKAEELTSRRASVQAYGLFFPRRVSLLEFLWFDSGTSSSCKPPQGIMP